MITPTNAEENAVAAKIRASANNRAFFIGISKQTEENGPIRDNW